MECSKRIRCAKFFLFIGDLNTPLEKIRQFIEQNKDPNLVAYIQSKQPNKTFSSKGGVFLLGQKTSGLDIDRSELPNQCVSFRFT